MFGRLGLTGERKKLHDHFDPPADISTFPAFKPATAKLDGLVRKVCGEKNIPVPAHIGILDADNGSTGQYFWNPDRSKTAITVTSAGAELPEEELEGLLSHELGHAEGNDKMVRNRQRVQKLLRWGVPISIVKFVDRVLKRNEERSADKSASSGGTRSKWIAYLHNLAHRQGKHAHTQGEVHDATTKRIRNARIGSPQERPASRTRHSQGSRRTPRAAAPGVSSGARARAAASTRSVDTSRPPRTPSREAPTGPTGRSATRSRTSASRDAGGMGY